MDSLIQEITQKENEYLSPTKKLCQAIQLSILEKCWEAVPLETTKFEMGDRRTLYCHK